MTAKPSAPPAPRTLRPYQREAVEAVLAYWGQDLPESGRRTPVVVLPTGTGKSTVIASLAVESARRGLRVVMLAHRQELLDQMAASVAAVDPSAPPVGIVQGERDNPTPAIVAASFQTLAANPSRLESLGRREVVLVDEMHHSTAMTYHGVLEDLGATDGRAWVCGFTATASRADGGLGQVWDTVVYERSLAWAIRSGYLVRPRGLTVVLPDLDLTEVTVRSGDYAPGELSEAMASSVGTTVAAMRTHAAGRRSIVFAAGVDHAEGLAAALTASGVPAGAVTGAMSTEARAVVYDAFRSGELEAMVTVQVLTEGADFPMCDCVVMARPTRSQVLYSQMVGRAVRLYPGKDDALVLDLAGTVRDMSLVTLSSLDPDAPAARVSPTSVEDPGQEERPKRERVERIGPVALEDVDLLATSPATWLATPRGVRFLDCQDGTLVFLWPANPSGHATVGVMRNPPAEGDGFDPDGPLPLEAAVERAESIASAVGVLPSREAAWRKRGAPSDGQVRLARSLRVPDAERKTRARLSDDISTALAAARLDPYVS